MGQGISIKLWVDDQGTVIIDRFAATGGKKIKQFTAQASQDLDKFKQSSSTNMLAMAASAAAAVTSVYLTTKRLVDAYADQERAENSLAKSMANAGQLTKDRFLAYRDYIGVLSKSSTYSKAEITTQMALLQSYGMTEAQLKKAIVASLDLASGMNKDLGSAALVVGKAFVGTTASLGRWGIKVDESLPASQKFGSVLEQINDRWGGRAAADLNTYVGQLNQFEKVIKGLEKSIGGALVPALDPLMQNLSKWIDKNSDLITQDVARWVKETSSSFSEFLTTAQAMKEIYDAIPEGGLIGAIIGFKFAGPEGAAVGAGIGTITMALKNLYDQIKSGQVGGLAETIAAAYSGGGAGYQTEKEWSYSVGHQKPPNIDLIGKEAALWGTYSAATGAAALSTAGLQKSIDDNSGAVVRNYWDLYKNQTGLNLFQDEVENSGKALDKLSAILLDAQKAWDTRGMSDYQVKLYDIQEKYAEQVKKLNELRDSREKDRISLDKYNASLAVLNRGLDASKLQAQNDALKEQQKVLDDITSKSSIAERRVGMTDLQKSIDEVNVKWDEEIKKLQEVFEKTKGLEGEQQRYAEGMRNIEAGRIADINEKQNEELQKQNKEYFDSIEQFYNQALSGIGNKTGSILDMITDKLKNLLATVASKALTSITMSLLGLGGGGDLSLAGLLGFGSGKGGGTSTTSLINTGSSLYRGYGWLSSLFGSSLPAGAVDMGTYTSLAGMPQFAEIAASAEGTAVASADAAASSASALSALAPYLGYAAAVFAVGTAFKGYSDAPSWASESEKRALGNKQAMDLIPGLYKFTDTTWQALNLGGNAPWKYLDPMTYAMEPMDEYMKTMRLARGYYRGVSRTANADISNMTLSQYTRGGSGWLSSEAVDAAITVGGADSKTADTMRSFQAIALAYQKAVQETGGASAQAIGQFQRVQVELDNLKIKAAGATGASRDLLNQFIAIGEKTKTLQIKELTTDLQQGIGIFSNTIDKLKEVGMNVKDFNTLVATEGLKFLTTDTLPALYGELSKVRDEYRAAAAEVKKYQEQTDAAAIKQAILTSSMGANLTEAQLMTLKYGTVNTDMIALYKALGWTNVQLTLVSAAAKDDISVWQALSDASKQLTSDIDGLAKQYANLKDVPEAAKKAYAALQSLAAGLDMAATAGQKLSDLPDVLTDMQTAIEKGDLSSFNGDLLKLGDTVMYLTGLFDALGMAKAAALLGPIGEAIAIGYGVIEAGQAVEGMIENLVRKLSGNTEIYDWMVGQLNKIDAYASEHGNKWLSKWVKKWFGIVQGEGITGSTNDYSNMDFAGAVAVGARYAQQNPYIQQQNIQNEAARAIELYQQQIAELQQGGVTPEEQDSINALNLMITTVRDGATQAADDIMKAFTKSFDDTMAAIEDYQSGLTRSKYNVFANATDMASLYGQQYRKDWAAFQAGSPEDIAANWGTLQTSAQSYLDYMYQEYGPTKAYQDVYKQIQAMLDSAQVTVGDKKAAYLSKYEVDAIAQAQSIAKNTEATANEIVTLRTMLKDIFDKLPKNIGKEVALAQPAAKR